MINAAVHTGTADPFAHATIKSVTAPFNKPVDVYYAIRRAKKSDVSALRSHPYNDFNLKF